MENIWSTKILDNTVEDLAWFAGILAAGLLLRIFLVKGISRIVYRLFKQQGESVGFDEFLSLVKKPLGRFISLSTIYFAFDRLHFPYWWHLVPEEKFGLKMIIIRAFETLVIIAFSQIILRIIDFIGLILIQRSKQEGDPEGNSLVPFIKESVKVIFIIFAFFFILGAVFSVNISGLIAGLGIGGLAVALAAKETLENLLGSFTIFFDKPFKVGDLISIEGTQGTVEKIGFRSTHIKTPDQSVVTFSNKKMVESKLENFTERRSRRVLLTFSLKPMAQTDVLKKITGEIKQQLGSLPELEPVQYVTFFEFAPGQFIFRLEYFITNLDISVHYEVREKVNLIISDCVHRHGAEFATEKEK